MDQEYMRVVLDLAAKARGRTSPNPMVGAVVVRDGEIVGHGYHARAGLPHAEIVALAQAGEAARGSTLYVSLEPCCHFGRTGPCTEAVIAAGVRRVVTAMRDPNPKVAGRGIARLREAGLEVTEDVLREEAARLNEVFIKYITTGRPFVALKAAVSLDGKIATRTGDSRWITGGPAREYAHRLRDTYDALLVGRGTVVKDDPSLTTRLPEGGRDPARVVLDSLARIPESSRMLSGESAAPVIVAVTGQAPRTRVTALESRGVQVVRCGPGPAVDLETLLRELAAREITSVLVEGGGAVHASFLEARFVDKLHWFVAPKIVGGVEAPGAVAGQGVGRMSEAVGLERVRRLELGDDFCIEGYPVWGRAGTDVHRDH
jgi:diaminohydroxyphosphoribosylaminopyrimidine deaminase/5-amino-6-(5-phosphoribosylamino)uracil reductase